MLDWSVKSYTEIIIIQINNKLSVSHRFCSAMWRTTFVPASFLSIEGEFHICYPQIHYNTHLWSGITEFPLHASVGICADTLLCM